MPDKKDKKRDAPISIRVPRDALAEFTRRAEKSGLSRNAFVLKCVLEKTPSRSIRHPCIEKKILAKLLVQAAKIHGELQHLNAAGSADPVAIEQAVAELTEIRAALLLAMERSP